MSWVRVSPEAADFSLKKSLPRVCVVFLCVYLEGILKLFIMYTTILHVCMFQILCIVNPRRTCAARVIVVCWSLSCVSVCLSVTTLAKASVGSTPRKRYVQHWYRLFSMSDSAQSRLGCLCCSALVSREQCVVGLNPT